MIAKILVVDDEPDLEILLRQKFRKKIKQNQLELFFASNGIEALQKLADKPDIDMVLTDINMPVMDGLTLLERIKKLNPFLKAVIVSAYGDMENIRKAMNLGAFDFLVKPINFHDLEITTQKTLGQIEQIKVILEEEIVAKQEMAELSRKLQENQKKLARFLQILPIGICVVNDRAEISYINQNAEEILGIPARSKVMGQKITDIYQLYSTETREIYPIEARPIMRSLQGEKTNVDDVSIYRNNQIVSLEISTTPIKNRDRNIVGAIAVFQDITSRKQTEIKRIESAQKEALLQQLNFLANYDRVTKIANRRRFDECLELEWQRMKHQTQPLSLIVCEIDNYIEYREQKGDSKADSRAIEVARSIRTVAELPGNLVARYQEAIFAVILPNTSQAEAINIAEQIRQAVKDLNLDTVALDKDEISLSLGVVYTVPGSQSTVANFIDDAIEILDRAKIEGGDRVCAEAIL